jgi:fumarate reductase subunit D
MMETVHWNLFRRAGSRNQRLLLVIIMVMVFPTRSYFIQEIRFWLVVLAVLVALGMLLVAIFILLREAGHRGHHWMKRMKMHFGKSAVPKHGVSFYETR